jgi:hypothetical protein
MNSLEFKENIYVRKKIEIAKIQTWTKMSNIQEKKKTANIYNGICE